LNKILAILSFLFLSHTYTCIAQDTYLALQDNFPDAIYKPVKSLSISGDTSYLLNAQVLANQHTGLYKEIRTASSNISIGRNRSRLVISIKNSQETELIQLNQFQCSYGVNVRINKEYSLETYLGIGLISSKLGDENSIDYSSDITWDSQAKLALFSKKNYVHFKVQHLNKPTLKTSNNNSLQYSFDYNILFEKTYKIRPKIKGSSVVLFEHGFNQNTVSIGSSLTFNKTFSVALGVQTSGDILIIGDYQLFSDKTFPLKLILGYEIQRGFNMNSTYSPHLFHIGLSLNNKNLFTKVTSKAD